MEVPYGTEDVVFFVRAREGGNSVAKTNRVNVSRAGRGGSPLDSFFFFFKFCVWQKFIKNHSPAVKTPDLRL